MSEQQRTSLNRLGHFTYALLLVSKLGLAEELWIGWVGYSVGGATWAYIGYRMRMSSIWVWEGVCVATSLWGLWRWTG